MIVRPVDFAVVQQMNEVSHIKQKTRGLLWNSRR